MGRRGAELILTPHSVAESQRSAACVGFLPYEPIVLNSSTVLHIYILYVYSILYTYSTSVLDSSTCTLFGYNHAVPVGSLRTIPALQRPNAGRGSALHPVDPYTVRKPDLSAFRRCMGQYGSDFICSLEFTETCVRSESGDFCFWQTALVQPLIRGNS